MISKNKNSIVYLQDSSHGIVRSLHYLMHEAEECGNANLSQAIAVALQIAEGNNTDHDMDDVAICAQFLLKFLRSADVSKEKVLSLLSTLEINDH